MHNKFICLILILFLSSFTADSFKNEQLRYSRVRQAYKEKKSSVSSLVQKNNLDLSKLNIYLRAFKKEKMLELWGKNNTDSQYKLLKTYDICQTCGELGPKRQQGDLQIPEGYYHINIFNPSSNFYLSLGINYPNKSDRILGVKGSLGGDIFIHGDCVTIGCLPITNDQIKELYVFCTEARNNGQVKIPVTIFPSQLVDNEFKRLTETYSSNSDKVGLWTDLKKGFDIFNETKKLPTVGFLNSGRHNIR